MINQGDSGDQGYQGDQSLKGDPGGLAHTCLSKKMVFLTGSR